jgi:hypothetical protein
VQPYRPSQQPAPSRDDPIALTLAVLLVVLALGAAGFTQLPASHAPRLLGAAALLGVGLAVAVWTAGSRTRFVALGSAGAGVGLAVLAWWFVPIINGPSLWSAERQAAAAVAELQGLPPDQTERYSAIKGDCSKLGNQFPFLKPGLQAAADAWVDRSVSHWEQELARLPAQDYAGLEGLRKAYASIERMARVEAAETAWFEKSYLDLKAGDFAAAGRARAGARETGAAEQQVRSWEEAWAARTAAAVLAEVQPLLANDPGRASGRLRQAARELSDFGDYPQAQEKLAPVRRQAVGSCLEAARRRVRALLAQDRFQEAADVANRLQQDFGAEAKAVGADADLAGFRDSTAFLAELARRAAKPEAK